MTRTESPRRVACVHRAAALCGAKERVGAPAWPDRWRVHMCEHQRRGITTARCSGYVFVLNISGSLVLLAEITAEERRALLDTPPATTIGALERLGLTGWPTTLIRADDVHRHEREAIR